MRRNYAELEPDGFHELPEHIELPVYLDDNPEMLVNPAYMAAFDSPPAPLKTHTVPCPAGHRHVDHYSVKSNQGQQPAFKITIEPVRPRG